MTRLLHYAILIGVSLWRVNTLALMQLVGAAAPVTSGVPSPNDVGLPPRASLTLLLTTESLIFAAFSITTTLALPTERGRNVFFTRGWFGAWVVTVLAVIAIAATLALVSTLEPVPPQGFQEWFVVVAIGLGAASQPLMAIPITVAAVKTRPAAVAAVRRGEA